MEIFVTVCKSVRVGPSGEWQCDCAASRCVAMHTTAAVTHGTYEWEDAVWRLAGGRAGGLLLIFPQAIALQIAPVTTRKVLTTPPRSSSSPPSLLKQQEILPFVAMTPPPLLKSSSKGESMIKEDEDDIVSNDAISTTGASAATSGTTRSAKKKARAARAKLRAAVGAAAATTTIITEMGTVVKVLSLEEVEESGGEQIERDCEKLISVPCDQSPLVIEAQHKLTGSALDTPIPPLEVQPEDTMLMKKRDTSFVTVAGPLLPTAVQAVKINHTDKHRVVVKTKLVNSIPTIPTTTATITTTTAMTKNNNMTILRIEKDYPKKKFSLIHASSAGPLAFWPLPISLNGASEETVRAWYANLPFWRQ